jgi:hypothetical protein
MTKKLANWKEHAEKGFKYIEELTWSFGQNWEPNYTQFWKTMQIQGQIKWLSDKFAKKLSSRINLSQIKIFN